MQHSPHRGLAFNQFGPGTITPVVKALLYANIAVFLVTELAPRGIARQFILFFGFTPAATLEGLRIWQPFTYMFLHGGVFHILFNMLVLWMFGVQLERVWGSRFFLKYYTVAGVGAALITLAACWLPFTFAETTYITPTIGASGAVYGLLLAFAIYYPHTPILVFLLFPVPAKYFVMILGAIAFISAPRGDGIGHVTHLGGLAAGYWYLRSWRGTARGRLGAGRLGVMADIKYRYVKWKMGRLRKKFAVYPGKKRNWDDTIH
jgi:membrane associated rhomboid family serine protease